MLLGPSRSMFCLELTKLTICSGANLIANCWGPALGAKAVSMRTALILGVICQCLGNILFGPEEYTVYGGFIDSWHKLAPYPGLTLYSLMWIVFTPVIWQALAIWQKTLVPAYLGAGTLVSVYLGNF